MKTGDWLDVYGFPAEVKTVTDANYTVTVHLPGGVWQERTYDTLLYPEWPKLAPDRVPKAPLEKAAFETPPRPAKPKS